MKLITIVVITALGITSCAVDEGTNRERIRLAEGHYNLGQYDQSIAHSGLVPRESKYYLSATNWNRKARKADEEARKLGYNESRIGTPHELALNSRPRWEINIPKQTE